MKATHKGTMLPSAPMSVTGKPLRHG